MSRFNMQPFHALEINSFPSFLPHVPISHIMIAMPQGWGVMHTFVPAK
jgi:hypothetical protein